MHQKLWDDFLLYFGVQEWDHMEKKMKSFLKKLKLEDVRYVKIDKSWKEELEQGIEFTIMYKKITEIFYFKPIDYEKYPTITGIWNMQDEDLSMVFKLELKESQIKTLTEYFYRFYKIHLEKEFHEENKLFHRIEWVNDIGEDYEDYEDYSEITFSQLFEKADLKTKLNSDEVRKYPIALINSLDSSKDCYVFLFVPQEEILVKECELNTWIDHKGAPVLKFYRRMEEYGILADYTFEKGKEIQMVFIPSYDYGDSFVGFNVYWHDHHLWYRLNEKNFHPFKEYIRYLGTAH